MKLLRSDDEAVRFSLNRAEKGAFTEILDLYPLVPATHLRLSKSITGRKADEGQRLLDDALAEQRTEHRQRLQAWLKTPQRFRPTKTGCILAVDRTDAEWLLQVLNDIRVGSWLLLGAPEDRLEPDEVDPKLQSLWATMEISGLFQISLLHALEGHSHD